MSDAAPSRAFPLPWIFLSGVLGLFAVSVPNSTGPAPPPAEAKNAVAPPPVLPREEPLRPLRDFFAVQKGRPEAALDLPTIAGGLHGYEVEFLIATVPDPIDSPFGFAFDSVVDAIQRGVERRRNYVLDRTWLPWEDDRKAKPGDGKERPKDAPALGAMHEEYPGVMLFRHPVDAAKDILRPGICVVFLVGETSLSGLHKKAFRRALEMIARSGQSVEEPIRVVGPYFSGSQTSLQLVIADWWEEAANWWWRSAPLYRFNIISGSAGALRKSDFLAPELVTRYPNWHPDRIELSSTIVPAKTTLNGVIQYLARRDSARIDDEIPAGSVKKVPGKIALLAEANTGFGKTFVGMGKTEEVLVMRFPMHISRLKNDYTQAFRKRDEQTGLKSDDPLANKSFDEVALGTEGVPSQGGAATTANSGQVLSRILTLIAKEQCRYVGVMASDSRDKLFLIRLLREYVPDVHIFVIGADLLLTHPDYRYHTRGVIVGSTYPLWPQNQAWVKTASAERLLFPAAAAQGTYNATLAQMGLADLLLEYRPPAFALSDQERPAALGTKIFHQPPIWVSMIAPNGTFVPLHWYANYEDPTQCVYDNYRVTLPAQENAAAFLPRLHYPGAMLPLGGLLCALWVALVVVAVRNRSNVLFWKMTGDAGERFELSHLLYRNLLIGVQMLLLTPLLALVWTHGLATKFTDDLHYLVVGLPSLLFAALAAAMFLPLLRIPRASLGWSSGRFGWVALNLLLIGGFLTVCVGFFARYFGYGDLNHRVLFFVRAVDLGSGLSPLTPLFFLCAGYASWAFFQLKRLFLGRRFEVPLPFPAVDDGNRMFGPVHDADARLRAELDHARLFRRHRLLFTLVLVGVPALAAVMMRQANPSVEGWVWDAIFGVGFTLLFGLIATSIVHLACYWQRIARLLERLELLPIMRSLQLLPPRIVELFGRYLYTQTPQLTHLQLPAHQARLLADAVAESRLTGEIPAALADVEQHAKRIEGLLEKGLRKVSAGKSTAGEEATLRAMLSELAACCMTAMQPSWRQLTLNEAFARPAAGEAAAKIDENWQVMAEKVIGTQIALYLSQYFIFMRNMVWAVVVGSSLLVLSATSYPFHPERLLLLSQVGLCVAGLSVVMLVLVAMNRDEVISRISRGSNNRFGLDSGLVGSILTYIVPALGLVAAQLSGSFRWLLEPLLRVLK